MPGHIVQSPALLPQSPEKMDIPALPSKLNPLDSPHFHTPPPPGQVTSEHPKLKVIDPKDCTRTPWKNGLGESQQIAIHPPQRNAERDEFIWRLSTSSVNDSCSFSVFPGYDVGLLLLSEEANTVANRNRRNSFVAPALLHHNDQEKSIPFKPLSPYTYPGEWTTTCRVKTSPLNHISFVANRERAQVSMNIETICPHGLTTEEGLCENGQSNGISAVIVESNNRKDAAPTSKMLLGHFTIVYVIKGGIQVEVNEVGGTHVVLQGQTLVCEREDDTAPVDFAITCVHKDGTPIQLGDKHDHSDHEDATILIIQVNLILPERRPSLTDLPLRPRGRAGSIIVYDDQPGSVSDFFEPGPPVRTSTEDLNATSGLQPKQWESARHYRPPQFSNRWQLETDVPPPAVKDNLVIDEFPRGKISTCWLNMMKNGLSEWVRLPVIVARGVEDGPVLGITAVIHGNELNGVPCIHRVITDIDVSTLKGTVVAVPCVNVPGYLRYTREFSDGKDLNRCFPGKEGGTASQYFAHQVMGKLIGCFDYLIDLHTASFGRINSYYVRSDMNDPITAAMAKLQQPQIILHNSGQDGTMRSAAASRNVKAITVEIGNPQLFQNQYVQWSYMGVMRILAYFNMFDVNRVESQVLAPPPSTILCSKGFWVYTGTGGVLEVYPNVNTVVRKGALIARIKNIFGNVVDEIYAPSSGVAIGKSSNPVAMAGDRVLHIGVIRKEGEALAKEAKENY
ncbi:hypothetical protein HK097_000601 [Rhizophlyctis rosea]|uniref:Succinylglutamate desuccinylase/Aspartoacylase catalytic domain-containing protein n=1 Tax=Rhizophlyctis rosea TaxID=64517 RepID=A0AAD5S7X7_9FUNG|nr:hypothetical protein HK097_000601 [Rhizophlyctis rosea]